ncbi:histidinol dehydrogenase [Marivivens niveibacter]|uniref:Histidinol dehydrogenase homolog n=1 Tax=Marivivens niveibacter TaxID=1930667 RepID=A0A251X0U7_9RHOB|nr:histidinol dehydrogenase [Marivivens niveibacter]OUD10018.1 histidinol dehydrogenase [Marivivens niveibacter]
MTSDPFAFDGVTFIKAPTIDEVADGASVSALVADVLADVKTRGDAAVHDYSVKFDSADIKVFEVTPEEREAALARLDDQTRADTEFAIENVRRFAQAQLDTMLPLEIETLPGVHLGHRIIPMERVGCYVPGGRYPLLSAPIMSIVPAKVAGVDEVIACLPPNAHEAMIAGCHLSGADRIFRIGGAQAIAAMAFGTETVPQVNKIVGPGNAFVNEAKRQIFGPIGIDQLAGPSEIFVVADGTGDAEMIATDLLAQAEHDIRTRVGLITTSESLANAVAEEVERQLQTLSTAEVARKSWIDRGEIALAKDEAAMIRYSDFVAAEHLQVHTEDPKDFALKLRNYGSLFIGELASVVYSDKCCGTNHTLPTQQAGRYTGGLWVGAYVKVCTHQWMSPEGVAQVAPPAVRQSASEGLEGHRRAAALRLSRLQREAAE